MKVVTTHPSETDFDTSSAYRVYSRAGWEMLGENAEVISVHSLFEAAMDAAARDEVKGYERVVVCFDSTSEVCRRSLLV